MIQLRSILKSADNTGAITLMCIRILGKNVKYGKVGDIFIGVIKTAVPNKSVKRSDIVRAIIVRTKKFELQPDNTILRFTENGAVIIDKDNNPKGTRIFGAISKTLLNKKFKKIVSLAPNVF